MIEIDTRSGNPLGGFSISLTTLLVKKTAITYVRELSLADREKCFYSPNQVGKKYTPGFIWTNQGLQPQNEIICRGIFDELWPSKWGDLRISKKRHPDFPNDDADGWGAFINIYPSYAIQVPQEFKIIYKHTSLSGELGDFLLMNLEKTRFWLCENEIFRLTYVDLGEQNEK